MVYRLLIALVCVLVISSTGQADEGKSGVFLHEGYQYVAETHAHGGALFAGYWQSLGRGLYMIIPVQFGVAIESNDSAETRVGISPQIGFEVGDWILTLGASPLVSMQKNEPAVQYTAVEGSLTWAFPAYCADNLGDPAHTCGHRFGLTLYFQHMLDKTRTAAGFGVTVFY